MKFSRKFVLASHFEPLRWTPNFHFGKILFKIFVWSLFEVYQGLNFEDFYFISSLYNFLIGWLMAEFYVTIFFAVRIHKISVDQWYGNNTHMLSNITLPVFPFHFCLYNIPENTGSYSSKYLHFTPKRGG